MGKGPNRMGQDGELDNNHSLSNSKDIDIAPYDCGSAQIMCCDV